MQDHPYFGALLFAFGAVLVGLALYGSTDGAGDMISPLTMGYVFVLNGVLYVILGCRKLEREHERRRLLR